MTRSLVKANVVDSLTIFNEVLAPVATKGVIIRRPPMVGLAERFDWDMRAVHRLQKIRKKYGKGPVLLSTVGQPRALLLSPEHVRRVLEESPETFATASSEKVAALAHFEPKGALISDDWEQKDRMSFNDEVLDSDRDVHRLADPFLEYIDEEVDYLIKRARREGELPWKVFHDSWFRVIRRAFFGEGAADDRDLIEMLEKLRSAGNWAFLHPGFPALRDRFHDRVRYHLARAEEGSLAARIAEVPKTSQTAPHHQVPQYLFAADPAGMTTFRTMALLAAHPEVMAQAQAEVDSHGGHARANMPYLRACVLESLRLWPTTPLVLRESTRETEWDGRTMPKGTGIIIFASLFHRDDEHLDFAHRFTPQLWLRDEKAADRILIPFSGGANICPGRNLVLLLSSAMIGALLEKHDLRLIPENRLRGDRSMPGILNNYDLRFALLPRRPTEATKEARERIRATTSEHAPVPVQGVSQTRATE